MRRIYDTKYLSKNDTNLVENIPSNHLSELFGAVSAEDGPFKAPAIRKLLPFAEMNISDPYDG